MLRFHHVDTGMEAVIQATSQEEIEQAVTSQDISIISIVGKTVDEAVELRQYIPDRVRDNSRV